MGIGHLMAGVNGTTLQVVRTDVAGVPAFNNYYTINIGAMALNLTSVQITERSATSMILIGTFQDPASLAEGFFFLDLNAAGALNNLTCWRWTGPGVTAMTVQGMFNSGNARFYVVGSATYTAGGATSIVPVGAAFDAAGANIWARLYPTFVNTTMRAGDVELYAPDGRLYMVGFHTAAGAGFSDAFMVPLDPANGNPLTPVNLYGGPNTNESFSGVTTCNSVTAGGQVGLLMGGSSNIRAAVPQNYDGWILKANGNGTVLASNLYDYSPVANADNFGVDIVERRTPAGAYTYFLGGWVIGGFYGANDMHVVKTNDVFTSIGNYTYGSALVETLEQLTVNNATGIGAFAGLGVYGTQTTSAANRDFLLAKTYFNGVTQCNWSSHPVNTTPGPGFYTTTTIDVINSVGSMVVTLSAPTAVAFGTHCNAISVAGGSNAKTAEGSDEALADFMLEIQALSGVSNLSAITVTATESVKATVEVTSITGQQLYRGEMDLNHSGTQLPNTGELPAGVLVVKVVAGNGIAVTKKVLLQ